MALGPLTALEKGHVSMLLAQRLTFLVRLFHSPQHGALSPDGIEAPLLPVESEEVGAGKAELAPEGAGALGDFVAEGVLEVDARLLDVVVPGAADLVEVEAAVEVEAVAGAGGEAGDFRDLVGEAEVGEDVGGVLVEVVVVELEVVGLAVFG